jgi:hypothetical protein
VRGFTGAKYSTGAVGLSPAIQIMLSAVDGSYVLKEVLFYNDRSFIPQQAVVTYGVNCIAAHIYTSGWRCCLDVDEADRRTRIARTWLNA